MRQDSAWIFLGKLMKDVSNPSDFADKKRQPDCYEPGTMQISNRAEPAPAPTPASSDAFEGVCIKAGEGAMTAAKGPVEAAPTTWTELEEARQYVRLAVDLQRDGRSLKAGRYAKRALSLFERASRTTDYEAIVARLCLADSRFVRGDFARAGADYRDAVSSIAVLTTTAPSCDVRNIRAQAVRGQANAALARGETLEAERQLLRALDIAEYKTGSAHESSAMLMDDLGTLYRQTGRYDEAARMQHLALSVVEETVGIEHPHAAMIFEHLALLEHARRQYRMGERFARQAAAIQERAFGPDHPRVANAFVVLASMLEGQGKLLEATQIRQAAQLIAQHWFGNDLEELAASGLIAATTQGRPDHGGPATRVAVRYA